MSFSEKEKQNILQPLQELSNAKCLMRIQSKQMEQNVSANRIIRPKTKIVSNLLCLMLFQIYKFILWNTKVEFLKDILVTIFNILSK